MTTSTALLGTIEQKNIKVGAWRFFAAPYDTYIDEAVRFDTVNPPAPFLDLGAVGQDASINLSKQLYRYMNGVPQVLKQIRVTGIDFNLGITLDQFSGANLARAIYGTNYAIKKFKSSPAIVQATGTPNGNVILMPSVANWQEGDYAALASSPSGLVTTSDEYKVVEISGLNLIFDRDVSTVFSAAPYVGDIESWKVPFGTSAPNKIAIVGCWDEESNGIQMLLAIPRATIDGNFGSGGIPAQQHQKITLNVLAQGFFDLDIQEICVANLIRINA